MKPEQLAALVEQLGQLLPGATPFERARFARSIACHEPYSLGPDAMPQAGVPKGSITAGVCAPGAVYPDVAHNYQRYVPAQYDASQPAGLIVFQDGARYLGPEANAPLVLDNLIHAGVLPPMVAVFIEPGAEGPGLPIYGGPGNRSVEYDSISDAYSRFLIEELLPVALDGLSITNDPAQRVICGLSSGGICAFNAAWQRPDVFGKVISHCGSFVNLRGGHELAYQVRRSERKPLKVSLQTGRHDLDIVFGRWLEANRELAAALEYRGYPHQLVVGEGGHSLKHGGSLLPDTLRWLFSREGEDQ
ncbi:MAG TPA: alpha/beta hydrolase-fold protein [Burkholderiaceae bacterium]|jgi:enterochelin esterase family protein